MLPVPNWIWRLEVDIEVNDPVVRVKLLRFRVLPVNANGVAAPKVNALPKVMLNELLKAIALNTTPLVVIVLSANIITLVVALQVVVADRVILPKIFSRPDAINWQVAPVVVIDLQSALLFREKRGNVMVGEPDAASTITSSANVGTEAPLAPPEVADQFVVPVSLQVPEPPTQYLFAI
jgi:hypothetical protein